MRSTREIHEKPKPAAVLRATFAAATVLFGIAAFLAEDGTRLFTASGAFGVIWWCWDLLVEHVFLPLEYWMEDVVGGGMKHESYNWSLQNRVALLEERMVNGKTRSLQVHAAIRLAEIYRLQKKDEKRAREVIEIMKTRYPDAPELQRITEETV